MMSCVYDLQAVTLSGTDLRWLTGWGRHFNNLTLFVVRDSSWSLGMKCMFKCVSGVKPSILVFVHVTFHVIIHVTIQVTIQVTIRIQRM